MDDRLGYFLKIGRSRPQPTRKIDTKLARHARRVRARGRLEVARQTSDASCRAGGADPARSLRSVTDRLDWGDGDYARTARTLEPAAEAVLDAAGIVRGERVLDMACGTGNAALAAARRGASAKGVDASEALLELARERAAESGADAEFAVGDAAALPVADASFDAVVSVSASILQLVRRSRHQRLEPRDLLPQQLGLLIKTSPLPSKRKAGRSLTKVLVPPPITRLVAPNPHLFLLVVDVRHDCLRLGGCKRLSERDRRLDWKMHVASPIAKGQRVKVDGRDLEPGSIQDPLQLDFSHRCATSLGIGTRLAR